MKPRCAVLQIRGVARGDNVAENAVKKRHFFGKIGSRGLLFQQSVKEIFGKGGVFWGESVALPRCVSAEEKVDTDKIVPLDHVHFVDRALGEIENISRAHREVVAVGKLITAASREDVNEGVGSARAAEGNVARGDVVL